MLKIVSGGQTGVDRAALDAAIHLGLECGGYCPKGRKSEDGTISEKYPLTETATSDYPERTTLNVKTGDGTLVFIDKQTDPGTSLTISLCKKYFKPYMVIDLSREKEKPEVLQWIKRNKINILNIAGNRESTSPGIGKKTFEFLMHLLKA